MTWRRTRSFTDTLTLEAIKQYLRVDFDDDDAFITEMITTSLMYVEQWRQKPSLDTDYTDQYGPFDQMPTSWGVEDTQPPTAQPVIEYVDIGGGSIILPTAEYTYDYIQDQRTITLQVDSPPDIQEQSLITVSWSVLAASPNLAIEGRKLLIANWYENREATVTGSNSPLEFGLNAVLSLDSLVM